MTVSPGCSATGEVDTAEMADPVKTTSAPGVVASSMPLKRLQLRITVREGDWGPVHSREYRQNELDNYVEISKLFTPFAKNLGW